MFEEYELHYNLVTDAMNSPQNNNRKSELPTRVFHQTRKFCDIQIKFLFELLTINSADFSFTAHCLVEKPSEMKILLFVVLTVIAIQSSVGFKTCPSKIPKGAPTAPKAGKYYQVMKAANKNDKATCYNLNISGSGKQLKIDQSMVVDDVILNYSYTAVSNVNGTWDVSSTNGERTAEIVRAYF